MSPFALADTAIHDRYPIVKQLEAARLFLGEVVDDDRGELIKPAGSILLSWACGAV